MDHEEAEHILNDSDLRKRSYTENLAVLNYQVSDLREGMKALLESQENQWKVIGRHGERIRAVETTWKVGGAIILTTLLGLVIKMVLG